MSYNMFTHVFDEMKRGFFDESYVRLDRLMAYECYEKAVESMTRVVTGRRPEYADKKWDERAVAAMTRFDLDYTIEWANKALMYLDSSEQWDEYFEKSDKLRQQTHNLWHVARALSQLRISE